MRMTGLGVSPGIGVGKALVLKRGTRDLRFRVPAWLVERELERLDTARRARVSRFSRSRRASPRRPAPSTRISSTPSS